MWTPKETFYRMVSFIEQDAAEKVEEIEESAEDGFGAKKAMYIREGCIKINQDYEKKIKKLEMQSLIFKSQKEAESRLQLAHCRYDHFQDVVESFKSQVYASINELPELYEATLKLLIEQATLKVLRPSMTIKIQERDKVLIKKMLPSIIWFYKEYTNLKVDIKIDQVNLLKPEKDMKVVVTALRNKVICEASLEKRLHSVVTNATPYIKNTLFDDSILKYCIKL